MVPCDNEINCPFGKKTEAQIEDFIERVANRAAARALAEVGLAKEDDKANIKELIDLIKNYKIAKKATKSAVWNFVKDTTQSIFKLGSKVLGVMALIYLLLKFGVDPSKVDQLTKVIK